MISQTLLYLIYDGMMIMQIHKQFETKFKQCKCRFKANMKSYTPLETTAIFCLANLFLKQGIGYVYVMVDFICTG